MSNKNKTMVITSFTIGAAVGVGAYFLVLKAIKLIQDRKIEKIYERKVESGEVDQMIDESCGK